MRTFEQRIAPRFKAQQCALIHQGPALDIVKLVDFGIAKLIPQDGGESLHLTKTGEVFGSPFT